jgi:type II secretory pathway pseudopilin PulG
MNTKNQKKSGFTLVELMIVAPTVVLVIGIFVAAIIAMTGDVLSSRSSNVLTYNIQNAMDRIKQDVSSSSAFLASNNISITSPQGYNNDATIFHNASASGNMLILNTYATTTNPANSNFDYVYSNHPNACGDSQVDQNQPITLNIVYFVKNGTLWRRIVAPSNYATSSCSKPWQQPSCAPGITNVFCKTEDVRLVDGIDSSNGFNISYYSDSTSATADPTASNSSASDSDRAAALEKTNTISVTINATSHTSGRTVNQTGTIRAASPNTSTAHSCPDGYINVPGNAAFGTTDFCVMKYEAKNVSGVATSQAAGLPWVSISQADATTASAAACSNCHLITDNELLTIAHNVLNVASNWSGGAVGSGYLYSGHNDDSPDNALAASTDNDGYYGTGNSSPSNQRRTLTLSNGEVIWDLAGNVWERTSGTFTSTFPTPADSWIEWNNSSLVMNGLSSIFRPSYSEPAIAASWTSAQGIGQLYTSSGTDTRGLRHGGSWTSGASAGVFYMSLDYAPSYTNTLIGFRVAQ